MEVIIICAVCALGYGYYEYKRGVTVGAETMLEMLHKQGYINIDDDGNVTSGDRNV